MGDSGLHASNNLASEESRIERAQRLALEIIDEARVQLMMKFRFLDLALWKMDQRMTEKTGGYTLATDGEHVYYEPYTVIGRFDADFNEVVRDYLHMIMHCLFRHPFDMTRGRVEAWWLVCDVIAENAAMELCGDRFVCSLDEERKAALDELSVMCEGHLTPGNLYGLFMRSLTRIDEAQGIRVSGARLNELQALFARDYHMAWPAFDPATRSVVPSEDARQNEAAEDKRESDGRDSGSGSDSPDPDEEKPEIWDLSHGQDTEQSDDSGDTQGENLQTDSNDADSSSDDDEGGIGEGADYEGSSSGDGEGDDDEREVEDEQSEEERSWEELAKQVEMDLESFSKDWGYQAGNFVKTLAAANRKKYDYSDFLRRFAALSEEMRINDDEFDYVFYTYGLKLYGNMPLVEPLEYKETNRIRDFVICIDTSESCDGELVEKFVEHTFNIMKKQEDYSHEVNIHVIQCDAKVQSDMQINNLKDVDKFMQNFTVRGIGGTDFRPAFAYVNRLVAEGELPEMKGLIYFTDGIGEFPEKAPEYDTAFVFMDEGDNYIPAVPPWAMRVLIDAEGINRFKSKL